MMAPAKFNLGYLACLRGAIRSRSPLGIWRTPTRALATPRKPNTVTTTIPKMDPKEFRKDLFTVPNVLTMTRIATAPAIGYFIVKGQVDWAAGLFTYLCLTDYVDGWIARRYNQKLVVGLIIDPLADKLLMTVCTVALSITHQMPALVATAIIGRDVMLLLMAFYYRYKLLLPPKSLSKFLDIQGNPTITVLPNTLGKVNTALQMFYIAGLVLQPVLQPYYDMLTGMDIFGVVVFCTTIASGCSYVFGKHAFRYVK